MKVLVTGVNGHLGFNLIKDTLGWQPQFSLEQSLHDIIDEIKNLKDQK